MFFRIHGARARAHLRPPVEPCVPFVRFVRGRLGAEPAEGKNQKLPMKKASARDVALGLISALRVIHVHCAWQSGDHSGGVARVR